MNRFASGPKRNYYGKGDVIVYRLHRRPQQEHAPVFGANVLMLLYGDAFWETYTTGDNSQLVATDSMKNFIQRETMNFEGDTLPEFCRYLAEKFLAKYPQTEGLQVSAEEAPYSAILERNIAFAPAGPERATARIELTKSSGIIESVSGIRNFRLLRLSGSAFQGFIRDEYTTLPDIANRPLHMWLDLEWNTTPDVTSARVNTLVKEVFQAFESGSIQQIIHRIGTKMLETFPAIQEIRLEANNRTWDAIAERGDELGVYTDARPPYGCLGLTLRR